MKKSFFVLLAATVMMSVIVSCQKEKVTLQSNQETSLYALGCELLPADQYAALPRAPEIQLKSIPASNFLPAMPIGNQGSEGSCVAFGTTYAARSLDWYIDYTPTASWNYDDIYSPSYVYNQIKLTKNCGSGTYVVYGLNLLKSQGVCTWNEMPYIDGQCSAMPNTTQKSEAAAFKIASYATVMINANTIKTYLALNKPVIVAGPVNMAFETLGNGQILGQFKGKSLGGHCYCLVGYDDSKNAFKFQNSWGTSWASKGYGWISYTYINSWWQEAYVIYSPNL